jgi:hypothetical protein
LSKSDLKVIKTRYVSIQPNVSVTFEQKYLLQMLLAGVTNAWRAFQLMHLELDEKTDWTYTNVRNKVRKSDHKLKKFMHQLGLSFIKVPPTTMLAVIMFYSQMICEEQQPGSEVVLLKHLGLIQIQTLYSNGLTTRCGQLEER